MRSKVRYSKESCRDMEGIWEHIAHVLQNPSAARGTLQKIMDAVDRLERFPEMGALLPPIAGDGTGYRFLVAGSYMVFHRTCGSEVYIDRVLYGRCDYLRILFGTAADGDAAE